MAGLIHKQYKIASSVEFLRLRAQIWKVQIVFLVIMAIMGFPTTLLGEMLEHVKYNEHATKEEKALSAETFAIPFSKQTLETSIFWVFIAGIYKDPRAEYMNYFFYPLITIAAGLFYERININWLENRLGCTYRRLQKFTELELRKE